MSNFSNFEKDLELMTIKANKPLILIESFDYKFIIDTLSNILGKKQTIVWHEGTQYLSNFENGCFYGKNGCIYKEDADDVFTSELSESISWFKSQEERYLIAFVSGILFANENSLIPMLQEFVYINNERDVEKRQTIILISATHIEVFGLEHICQRLFLPLPDKEDIYAELVKGSDPEGNPEYNYPFAADFRRIEVRDKNLKDLIDALYGMTIYDIRDLLHSLRAESPSGKIRQRDEDCKKLAERVVARKKQLVKNSGLLEVIDYYKEYHQRVGGIAGLRTYLENQKNKIRPVFLRSKLPKPKGVLLVGTPGCGKSESAIATASILGLPLYRINIGDLLGHKYGESENRFNEALRTADASAPCVLWIDEIEKAFAGAGNELENDDTLTHIVGRFLTWMQEHETLVYLVATANDLSKMRPELLRKGRWDEIFYLSYPELPDIREIISRKRKEYNIIIVDDNNQEIFKEDDNNKTESIHEDNITKKMYGMSGAEIVSFIVEVANKVFPYEEEDDVGKIIIPIKEIDDYINTAYNHRLTPEEMENHIKNFESKGYKSASKYGQN